MPQTLFHRFFQGEPLAYLHRAIDLAIEEDGLDLTSCAIFDDADELTASLVAKERAVVAGLDLVAMICERIAPGRVKVRLQAEDSRTVEPGDVLAVLEGAARTILKAERVVLNFVCHLSGIATLTSRYKEALGSSRTRLLDTRKTLPGLRYPEKYAVLAGGAENHRLSLAHMVMIKDNHIDRAGSVTRAVAKVRAALTPCPPIEVECRTMAEVQEAVGCQVERIMLDNMTHAAMAEALQAIPRPIQTEVSGSVSLDTLPEIGRLGADFVSVGRITHSAPSADFSLRIG